MYQTIILGYDESEASERALERAAAIAGAFGAKVVVTSVVPVVVGGDGAGTGPGEELRHAEKRLHELGIDPELVEAIGNPADAIAEVADRNHADLIVVGTREPSLVERALGMSVSEGVQRRSRCDVLIVH